MRTYVASAAVIGLASLAHADFFQVQSEGTFDQVEANEDFTTLEFETTIDAQVGPYGFTSAAGTLTQTFADDPDSLTGEVVLTGATPGDTLTAAYIGVFFGAEPDATFAGTWEVTDASGDYAGLVGDGQFSGFYLFEDDTSGQFGLVIQGDLVPAPGAAAILGLGALAAIRRRR